MANILAIDASLTGFAMCLITPEGMEQFEYSTKTAGNLRGRVDRVRHLADKAADLVKKQPTQVFLEGYSYGSRGKGVVSLGELGMILRDRVIDHAELFVEVPPTVLKLFATGKGNASKVKVASSLSAKFNKVFSSDNEADAFGLSQIGLCALGLNSYKLTKPQQKAVDTLKQTIKNEKEAKPWKP